MFRLRAGVGRGKCRHYNQRVGSLLELNQGARTLTNDTGRPRHGGGPTAKVWGLAHKVVGCRWASQWALAATFRWYVFRAAAGVTIPESGGTSRAPGRLRRLRDWVAALSVTLVRFLFRLSPAPQHCREWLGGGAEWPDGTLRESLSEARRVAGAGASGCRPKIFLKEPQTLLHHLHSYFQVVFTFSYRRQKGKQNFAAGILFVLQKDIFQRGVGGHGE